MGSSSYLEEVSDSELRRAFTDSSILVAASLSESGAAHGLFDFARDGRLVLFASPYALNEAESNLYKKNPDGLRSFWDPRRHLRLVDPSQELIDEVARHIEPKDAAIVAGAIVCRGHYLVTHDRRHLLHEAGLIQRRYGFETVPPVIVLTVVRALG